LPQGIAGGGLALPAWRPQKQVLARQLMSIGSGPFIGSGAVAAEADRNRIREHSGH